MQNNNEKKVVELKLSDVLPNRFQPRIKFDEESINELADSIKKYGVIQPIVVRQIGDKYEIIAGERRYKASVIAGKETIPAIIYELNDKESVEIALLENVQREDLTPIEKAISYKKILDMGYINQEELAQKIGKSQSSIANTLRLLNLSEEVQEALLNAQISERHARSLLKIKDENKQVYMLKRIINERLTVRKTDEEIEKMENENNIEIPDIKVPEDNYDLPGFMNIDKIEQEAKDIKPEEKPTVDMNSLLASSSPKVEIPVTEDSSDDEGDTLKPGKFFNLFDDDRENKEMEELLSGNNKPVMPEFNFEIPSVEAAPTVEPVMPEFNFEVPNVETTTETSTESESGGHRGGLFNFFSKNKKSNDQIQEEKKSEEVIENTVQELNQENNPSVKLAIDTIRNCEESLQKMGFTVDIDELDFGNSYQVTIKIDK